MSMPQRIQRLARRHFIPLVCTAVVAIALVLAVTMRAKAAAGCTSPTDCLSKMTLLEKIGQMTQADHGALTSDSDIATYALGSLLSGGGGGPNGAGGTAAQWADMYDHYQSIALTSRLGVPLIYGVDAVHGHNNVYGATVFPHNIGMGATRNPALIEQAQHITALEVAGTGIDWTFAPCLCVPRDERWGRTYEGYGETPDLVNLYTIRSIQGFQGTSLAAPDTILATAKHYVGDGGTSWGTGSSGYMIDQGDTRISEAELRAIHLPPYRDAITANVGSIMISYSSWNGQKMHGNSYLINDVLKGELGFQGFIISDWAGIDQLPGDYPSDVRTSINAGIDMVMVPSQYKTFISTLETEVLAGRVPQARIDAAVLNILEAKFDLDLFNNPYTDRSYTSQVGSAEHRAVARQAVRESLVLLKNSNNALPLDPNGAYKIVVGGRTAHNIGNQSGGWTISWQGASGSTTPGTTILQGIQQAVGPNVTVVHQTQLTKPWKADVAIMVIGETPYAEGRGDDADLSLSRDDVTAVNKCTANAPICIVILVAGRPMIISDSNNALGKSDAFIMAWLPGTEGNGVADVLFGAYNFTGKLPHSWPSSVSQVPINSGDGKTPLFPLGYGLAY